MKKQLIITLTVLLMAICLSGAVSAQENGELLEDELTTTSEISLPDPYNTRTEKSYITIQEAIDDPETLDGDTIQVDPGTYTEHVKVFKILHIVATGPDTIINGSFNITSTGGGSIIEGFIINSSGSDVWYGIIADGSSNNQILDNTINVSYSRGIELVTGDNNIIRGNTITAIDHALLLHYSSGNLIQDNNLNSYYGMSLAHSNDNQINDNNIQAQYVGVVIGSSDNNLVTNNTIISNTGIEIIRSADNHVIDNQITSTGQYGIEVLEADENTITGNTINASSVGIKLHNSSTNHIESNTITAQDGFYLERTSNENTITGNYITAQTDGVNIDSDSNDNLITGNTISGYYGLYIQPSSGSIVTGNTITATYHGILLRNTEDNIIKENNLQATNHGIHLQDNSNNNQIKENLINGQIGVYLDNSGLNEISDNTITTTVHGMYLLNAMVNHISGNSIDVPVIGINLGDSPLNHIISNTITSTGGPGIWIQSSSVTNITENDILSLTGIYLGGDNNNVNAHFNRILATGTYLINNEGTGIIDARNNWYGSNDNPASRLNGYILANPWLVMQLDVNPDEIPFGAQSQITADLTYNSDGEDTSHLGYLPEGILVTFTTNKGTIGSMSVDKPLENGIAQATLNGTESGTATVKAILDEEELSNTVEIIAPEYNLTTGVTGQGHVTKNPDMASYVDGSVVTLTAVADSGWSFSHWTGDLTGNTNPQTITMDANKSITAVFVEDTPETGIFTRLMVQDAARRVRNFITSRGVLPNWVRMEDTAGVTHYVTMPVFLELSTANLISSANEFKAMDVKTAPRPAGPAIVNRNLYKSGYLNMALRVNNFIRNNGVAPNFASSSLGNIRYQALVDSFARIVAFQSERGVLPNYVVINTRRVR